MITVAMTVYKRTRYTDNTLKSLIKNKKGKIELLFLMDNPGKNEEEKLEEFIDKWNIFDGEIKVYKQKDDGCINGLWNKVPELATNEKIFVINDDIEVSPEFDEVVEKMDNKSILCPFFYMPYNNHIIWNEFNISGHAWGITKTELKRILPIDKRLKLRFGDDWIFHKGKDNGLVIDWSDEIKVFHYTSKTCENPEVVEKVRKLIADDQKHYKEILKEQKRHDLRFPNQDEEFNKTSGSSEK